MTFKKLKSSNIDELACQLNIYEHTCGAKVLHIGNDDPENLFCLAFRTLPTSSNGVPHILEHTVLCGSKKYPVKDPFFSMIRRSLNTFMNAMTGDDMTFYPASSQVEQDFYNLLDVYLDAVFFPNLKNLSFCQEGHRLEFENDLLVRKGIVFNEMKGAMASATSRAWMAMMEALFPDTSYRFNSGGEPDEIPNLTYQGLLDFHKQYYHPSKCLFYFYGNLDIDNHLNILEERVLKDTTATPPLPPIKSQKTFSQPVTVTTSYPCQPGEESKAMVYFGWKTSHVLDPLETLCLAVVDICLAGTDAGPLKLALLNSGLCKEAYMVIDPEMWDVPMMICCKGCDSEKVKRLDTLIHDTLEQIALTEFPKEIIDAAIHQLEFGRSEITGDGSPYGLTLFRRAAGYLMFGGDPEDGLRIHTLFKALREQFKDPKTLGRLIQRYFTDNPHKVTLVLEPDSELTRKEEEAERKELDRLAQSLSNEEISQIKKQTSDLATYQAEEDDISCLPGLKVSDIPPKTPDYGLTTHSHGAITAHHHTAFTNEICYVNLVCDLPHLSDEDLFYAKILTAFLPELGAGPRNWQHNLEATMSYTGGISCSMGLNSQAGDINSYNPSLTIGGKALVRHIDKLFELMRDMAVSPLLKDKDRLQDLISQLSSALTHGLTSNAINYAINLAASSLSPAAQIQNRWGGVAFYNAFQKVARGEVDIDRLCALHTRLFTLTNPQLIVTCNESEYDKIKENDFYGYTHLTSSDNALWRPDLAPNAAQSHAYLIGAPVAFTSMAVPCIAYSHPDAPLIHLAAKLFRHTTLHPKIREQGGAYGAGSNYNPMSGILSFTAYRDPEIDDTLATFKEAVDTVGKGQFNNQLLDESKLNLIAQFDNPCSPGSRGSIAYSWRRSGKTVEMRQQMRDGLLSAIKDDIVEAVHNHIAPNLTKAATAVFAGKEVFEQKAPWLEPLAI